MNPIPDAITIRAVAPDELEALRGCVMDVFGMDPAVDPTGRQRLEALLDVTRTYCAFDGTTVVATAAAYGLNLTVCGGTVAMAGLTMVTVRPSHRRRGLLRRLIAAHLADAAAHAEPVSGLWASDAGIYGRFGYGLAAESDELSLGPDVGLARAGGDAVELLSDAAAAALLPAIYARATADRPGMFARSEPWWTMRRFTNRADLRRGRSPRRHVVARRGAEVTGYVVYRQQLAFDDGRPAGALDVEELVALDATAEASLWQHVTTIDLFPRVSYWNAATDAVVPWLAADRRRVKRKRRADTLWLRVGDVAAALAARRYLVDDRLALAVRVPDAADLTRVELAVAGGVGRCAAPSGGTTDLELDLAALGAIYLGGTAPSVLARAGQIRGSAEALARADALFRWSVAPWCAEVF